MHKGPLAPLHLNRDHAWLVAALIEARIQGHELTGTVFASLPAFARTLRAALRRRRRRRRPVAGDRSITLWQVERAEALAAFDFLWFLLVHPDIPDDVFASDEERGAADAILDALTQRIHARRGPKRLDRAAVAQRLRPPASEHDPDPVDESWMRRLRHRLAREDEEYIALRSALSAPPPPLPEPLAAMLGQHARRAPVLDA